MYMYKHKQICYLDMTDLLSRDNKLVILKYQICYLEITNLLSRDNKFFISRYQFVISR